MASQRAASHVAGFAHLAWPAERMFAVVFSLGYGVFLASLPVDAFIDRENYLNYAADSLNVLQGLWAINPLAALANEPLWLVINHGLSLLLSPPQVVQAIVFVSATTVSWLMLTRTRCHPLWIVLVLFLPQVLKNHIVHLRQGAAIAVFLVGWFDARKRLRWACFAATPFIHASFFFVLVLLFLARAFDAYRARALVRMLVGAGVCVAIGATAYSIAELTGARQADEYQGIANEISGMGFVLWSGVLALMLAQGRRFIERHSFALLSLGLYLGLYFFAEFSARVFESTLAVVLTAAMATTGWRRHTLQAIIVFLFLYQYLNRLGQPAFGYGI